MTDWSAMSPVEFDAARAATASARRFAETAAGTLFPRLMPEPAPRPCRPAAEADGQEDLFGGDQ